MPTKPFPLSYSNLTLVRQQLEEEYDPWVLPELKDKGVKLSGEAEETKVL